MADHVPKKIQELKFINSTFKEIKV